MKKTSSFLYLLAVLCIISACTQHEDTLTSPSGNIKLHFTISGDNIIMIYDVEYNEADLIDSSLLKLEFNNIDQFSGLQVVGTSTRSVDETWNRVWGKSKSVRNHCNESILSLQEKEGQMRKINIVFRAYDDGIAFRYHIPEQDNITDFELSRDETQFRFTDDHTVWATRWNSLRMNLLHSSINQAGKLKYLWIQIKPTNGLADNRTATSTNISWTILNDTIESEPPSTDAIR